MKGGHAPKALVQYFAIIVGKDMPLPHDLVPGDFRMLISQFRSQASRCLADDFDLPLNTRTQEQVRGIVFEGAIAHEENHRFARPSACRAETTRRSVHAA